MEYINSVYHRNRKSTDPIMVTPKEAQAWVSKNYPELLQCKTCSQPNARLACKCCGQRVCGVECQINL